MKLPVNIQIEANDCNRAVKSPKISLLNDWVNAALKLNWIHSITDNGIASSIAKGKPPLESF